MSGDEENKSALSHVETSVMEDFMGGYYIRKYKAPETSTHEIAVYGASVAGRGENAGYQEARRRKKRRPLKRGAVLAVVFLAGFMLANQLGSAPDPPSDQSEDKEFPLPQKAAGISYDARRGMAAPLSVKMSTEPSGAAVYIDRKPEPAGLTPASVILTEGPHGIKVEKEGYSTYYGLIRVERDGKRNFSFQLEKG